MRATSYLSASTQFVHKRKKSEREQRLFECEGLRVLRDKSQNLNVKSIKFALKSINHALE